MNLRIAVIQHVEFEGPAEIENWAKTNSHILTIYKLFLSPNLPSIKAFDFLIIMGGPMGVYDTTRYTWLQAEKELIADAIKEKKKVLGICLGAQLIASALGANVYQARNKEIGWWPIEKCATTEENAIGKLIPLQQTVFQWHGDTFDLPKGSIQLMRSTACENQAFAIENQVLALQYHIEIQPKSIQLLLENCSADIEQGDYIQTIEEITKERQEYKHNVNILNTILNQLVKN